MRRPFAKSRVALCALAFVLHGCLSWDSKPKKEETDSGLEGETDGGKGGFDAGGNNGTVGNNSGDSNGGNGTDANGSDSGSDVDGGTNSGGSSGSDTGSTTGSSCSTELCNDRDDDCDSRVDESCKEVDDCAALPCKNGGTCTDGDDTFMCKCPAGFEGPTCEVNIDECSPNPCLNGGTCTDGANGFTCSCKPGYQGDRCELSNNDCSPNPCRNGGTCTDATNGYTCACVAGYSGTQCETNINECAPNPCLNGGICKDEINKFTCSCPTGYAGARCETNVDDCAASPCKNGGTCIDELNKYSCKCTADYTGPTCELQFCAGTTIRTKAELAAYRMCAEVRGNLTIGPATDFSTIAATDLPYLVRVTGDFVLNGLGSPDVPAVVLSAVEAVGGNLSIGTGIASVSAKELRFPMLKTVGGSLSVTFTGVGSLDFPNLTTAGSANLGFTDKLCSANFRKVTNIGGQVSITEVPNLPASHVQALRAAARGGEDVQRVGCCTVNDFAGCESDPFDPICGCQP